MPKFRKKPVVIEARKLVLEQDFHDWKPEVQVNPLHDEAFIKTLEGTMRADHGDWIIKGVAGEFYPCKPDIFAATYEAVAE